MNLDQFNYELSKQRHEELLYEAQRHYAVGLSPLDRERQPAPPRRTWLLPLRRFSIPTASVTQAGGRL